MKTSIKRLLETPELVADEDFGLTADAGQQSMLAHIAELAPDAKPILIDGIQLQKAQSSSQPGTYYVYLVVNDMIEYYAMVSSSPVPPLKGMFAYQQAVWRGPGCPKGLPGAVFWQEVFASGKVASDDSQTQGGRIFWRDRVSEAYSKGYTVAAVDTKRKHVFEFADYAAFQSFAAMLYGGEAYRKYRIVISATKLEKNP